MPDPARPSVLKPGCPSRALLCRVGAKWPALIVRCLAGRTLRYNELQRTVAGISQKMLTQSLRALEADGLVTRKVHPVIPPMVEYSLTPLGRSLATRLLPLCAWAEKNLPKTRQKTRPRS